MIDGEDKEMPEDFPRRLHEVTEKVAIELQRTLGARFNNWKKDASRKEIFEVVGGLLARQVTLARELIQIPEFWNEHIAPMILRCMADVHISLAWIMLDPLERARRFIYYGLGQEKLMVEHRRQQIKVDGKDPDDDPVIQACEAWIDTQQYSFLTEVNVGSWSGIDTRKMAEEADCLSFYRYVYQPFSAAVHSMWNHVGKFNTCVCGNPLHDSHRVAVTWSIPSSLHYFFLTVKYAEKSLRLFDKHFPLGLLDCQLFDYATKQIEAMKSSRAGEQNSSS